MFQLISTHGRGAASDESAKTCVGLVVHVAGYQENSKPRCVQLSVVRRFQVSVYMSFMCQLESFGTRDQERGYGCVSRGLLS